jgi:hypothetical protein
MRLTSMDFCIAGLLTALRQCSSGLAVGAALAGTAPRSSSTDPVTAGAQLSDLCTRERAVRRNLYWQER